MTTATALGSGVEIHTGPGGDGAIDLGAVYVLLEVTVSRGLRRRTVGATVQVSADGRVWSDDIPADRVDGTVTRHLRVVDAPRRSTVAVRARHAEPSVTDKYVVMRRTDGLGERLNGLLNAMRLADTLGLDFRFSWPLWLMRDASHAIGPATELFSEEFLAAHLDETDVPGGYPPVPGPGSDLSAVRDAMLRVHGLEAPQRPLRTVLDATRVPGLDRGFSAEFSRIGWHPLVTAAMSAAHELDLGRRPVGIHLRAGDIIYGRSGRWSRYTEKCISAPVARHLVDEAVRDGSEVVVFGQDDDLIADLCASTGARPATGLRPDATWSPVVTAMFDLALLARCTRIISGTSGFAIQAAAIADTSVEHFTTLLTPAQVLAVTRDDLAVHRYSPEQHSFAAWLAYYLNRATLPSDDGAALLREAIDADPANPRHRLHLAALEMRRDELGAADDALRSALDHDVLVGGKVLASVDVFSVMTPGGFDAAELFPDFDRAIDAGSVTAPLYRAAVRARSATGDASAQAGARSDLALFHARTAGDPRYTPALDLADRTIRHLLWKASQT